MGLIEEIINDMRNNVPHKREKLNNILQKLQKVFETLADKAIKRYLDFQSNFNEDITTASWRSRFVPVREEGWGGAGEGEHPLVGNHVRQRRILRCRFGHRLLRMRRLH